MIFIFFIIFMPTFIRVWPLVRDSAPPWVVVNRTGATHARSGEAWPPGSPPKGRP